MPAPPLIPQGAARHTLDTDHSPLPTDARQLTRMVAMFWSARAVLNADIQLRKAAEEDDEEGLRRDASKA